MVLVLLEDKKMSVLRLPEKVSGKYTLNHINASGKSEQLLSAEGIDGKWHLYSSVYAKFLVDHTEVKEYIAEDGILDIRIPRTNSRVSLIIESDEKAFGSFFKRKLNRPCDFTVGSSPDDDISYKKGRFPLLDRGRLALKYSEGKFTITECSGWIYSDGCVVSDREILPGTQLFVGGIKLIIGKDYICGNYESELDYVNNKLFTEFIIPERRFGIEHEIAEDKVDNLFYCSPRFYSGTSNVKYEIESPPQKINTDGTPTILSIGPSMTMGMASVATAGFTIANNASNGGSIMNVAPTIVMAGGMILGSVMWPVITKSYDKKKKKKAESRRNISYAEYIKKMKDTIDAEVARQKQTTIELNPEYDKLFERIEHHDRSLWERFNGQPDFLSFSSGVGNIPADITLQFREKNYQAEKDPLYDLAVQLSNEERNMTEVPVAVSMAEDYILGVIGDRREVLDYARGILMQLTALHSYDEMRVVIITDESEYPEWEFARWLPHVYSADGDIRFIAADSEDIKFISAELEGAFDNETESSYVIISGNKKLASKFPLVKKILDAGEYRGFSLITLYDEMKFLPKECHRVIELNGNTAELRSPDGTSIELAVAKQPDYVQCEKAAVTLANIQLMKSDKAFVLPNMLTFMEMMDCVRREHLNCVQRWRENNPVNSLKAPIGVDENGDMCYLDLHQDSHGPHGLVAGMTGSGKSEFIMTYILSLALNYHPHEVSFILIDYKGGGMSKAFSKLPHLAGMITNLDGSGISRALVSIESELKRREHIFAEASEKLEISNIDIYKYQKLYRSGVVSEPMSHLFVISDEFAELKSQQPEFMDKLISTARIGRSLGVHLILATQKPSGVVSDQIWSNSRFKVCLKVQDAADSNDMIKRPDAAAISQTGRFYLQVGYNEMFIMGQSAWCGAAYHPDADQTASDIGISVINKTGKQIAQSSLMRIKSSAGKDKKEKAPKQLDTIVSYIREVADSENVAARPMWLPPLPEVMYRDEAEKFPEIGENSFRGHYACVGIYDAPEKQEQGKVFVSPMDDGNVAIYGSAGGGKLSFITTMICSMAEKYTPEDVNFYIMDFGVESLMMLRELPHVGEVITSMNSDRIPNLIAFIKREADERKRLFFEYGGEYSAYIAAGHKIPEIIVVINNYSGYSDYMDGIVDVSLFQLGKLGISFVVTAQMVNSLSFNVMQNFRKRICMHLNDGAYSVIMNKSCRLQEAALKGRGLTLVDKTIYEFQTAFVAESEKQTEFFRTLVENQKAVHGELRAKAVPTLPKYFTADSVSREKLSLSAVPVGLTTVSVEHSCFDFSQKYSLIVHKNVFESVMIQGVAEMLAKLYGDRLTVIDPFRSFIPCDMPYKYIGDKDSLGKFIDSLLAEAVEKYNTYDECEKKCKPLPQYDEQMFIFCGMGRIIASLNAEQKERLIGAVDNVECKHGFRFVIYDRISELSAMNAARSFVERSNQNDYIWVGDGYSEQYVLPQIRTTEKLTDITNGGYVISRRKISAVKLLCSENAKENADE